MRRRRRPETPILLVIFGIAAGIAAALSGNDQLAVLFAELGIGFGLLGAFMYAARLFEL